MISIVDLKVGDQVALTNPKKGYMIGESNPAIGTRYECCGTVISFGKEGHIRVKWDNGTRNVYICQDLSFVDNIDKIKKTRKCKSIW